MATKKNKKEFDPQVRTRRAVRLLAEDDSLTVASAAARVGVTPNAVRVLLKRNDARIVCPCCGHATTLAQLSGPVRENLRARLRAIAGNGKRHPKD